MAFIYYSLLLLVIGIIGLACAETKGVPIGTGMSVFYSIYTITHISHMKLSSCWNIVGVENEQQ